MQLVDGEASVGCTNAKNLAVARATKELYDEPHLDVNPSFELTGTQLASLTQALAYKGICKIKVPWDRH